MQRRVRNGRRASPASFPWIASIIGDGFTCAGSLVNSRYILTAAHCVRGRSASQLKVTLGAVTELDRLMKPSLAISDVILHDRYDGHIGNDVALLRLRDELPIDSSLVPVCLASDRSVTLSLPFLVGWGATTRAEENGMIGAKELMQAELDVKPDALCAYFYGQRFDQNKLCAGTCSGATKGDGGAPVMQRQGGRVTQVGITCFGTPTVCERPDLYESVAAHASWIRAHTQDGTYCE